MARAGITLREQWKMVSGTGNLEAMAQWQEGFFRRMWDVSSFMKALKQRFTQWFNGRHERNEPTEGRTFYKKVLAARPCFLTFESDTHAGAAHGALSR